MTGSAERALLFLDVDGPLLPFGAWQVASNPMLARLNPEHGVRLLALPCELVWATAWTTDANEWIAPLVGLPELPVVVWPEPPEDDEPEEEIEDDGLHWKTRTLVDWAAGRSFVWVDDEITDTDRAWVTAHHDGHALLRWVDPRHGLSEADFAAVGDWLRRVTADA